MLLLVLPCGMLEAGVVTVCCMLSMETDVSCRWWSYAQGGLPSMSNMTLDLWLQVAWALPGGSPQLTGPYRRCSLWGLILYGLLVGDWADAWQQAPCQRAGWRWPHTPFPQGGGGLGQNSPAGPV